MAAVRNVHSHKIVNINKETITNTSSLDYPHHFFGQDNSWSVDQFRENLQVEFHSTSKYDLTFSLVGVDASIANAFRRIMVAEVPTLAIENVYIYKNTSIIQDEVLSHRLGLIPLAGNRDGIHWLRWFRRSTTTIEGSQASDFNTVVLQLAVQCTWKEGGKQLAQAGERDPKKLYNNSSVYAHQIDFCPHGQQATYFSSDSGPIVPANPDILIAKLRPGQMLHLTMHCVKGIGADHAKFSPVSTASYRLLPSIDICRPIVGKDARKFRRCFPKGVIKLETVTAEQAAEAGSGYEGYEGSLTAVVDNPMKDTVSRECLRHPEFEGKVKLGRVQDHFIFRVESVGCFDSDEIFIESVRLLKAKCQRLKQSLLATDF